MALRFVLEAEAGETTRVVLRPRGFWGARPAIRLFDSARPKPAAWRRKVRAKGRPRWRPTALPSLRTLRDLVALVQIDRLDLDIRFGTGDPAETGRLFGYLSALVFALPPHGGTVRLHPDFGLDGVRGRAAAELQIRPLSVLGQAFRLIRAARRRRA